MSMFDPDDDAPDSQLSSPFIEPVDGETETPQPEDPSLNPLPPAGQQDSGGEYLSSSEAEPESPAETAIVPEGGADDSDWIKAPPVPTPVTLQPYRSTDESLKALKDQYAQEATENTKPSGWRRLAAGLAGGAVAFGSRNPGEGMNVVNQILNSPREQAEERWKRAERPLEEDYRRAQEQNAEISRENNVAIQQGNLADRDYRNQSQDQVNQARTRNFAAQAAARRNAPVAFTPDDPKNPYAGGTVQTADGRTLKGQAPPEKWIANWEKNPANKAAADAIKGLETLRQMEKAGIVVSPENRQIIASGGKVTPAVRTTVSIREGGNGTEQDAGTLIAKSIQDKQDFADQWQRVDAAHASQAFPEGSYIPANASLSDAKLGDTTTIKKSLTPQQFQNRIEHFRTNLNASPAMRKAGVTLDQDGNVVNGAQGNRTPVTTTRTTTNSAPQPQTPQTHTFSLSRWQAANPKGDPKAAQAAATQQGYRVIP